MMLGLYTHKGTRCTEISKSFATAGKHTEREMSTCGMYVWTESGKKPGHPFSYAMAAAPATRMSERSPKKKNNRTPPPFFSYTQ